MPPHRFRDRGGVRVQHAPHRRVGADGPTVAVPSPLTMTTIGVGVAVTLVLGFAPQYFLDLAGQAGVFVR